MFKKFLMILLLSSPALAHDWYPKDCCHERDCAPVEQWIPGKNPGEPPTVVTKFGRAKLTHEQLRDARRSPDGQGHACLIGGWSMDGKTNESSVRKNCIWLPESL